MDSRRDKTNCVMILFWPAARDPTTSIHVAGSHTSKKVGSSRPYFGTCARARVTSERANAAIPSHVRPLVRTRPSTRTSRVRPLVRLHVRWLVRTSVTTFICTRTPYVHFLPTGFKNTFYETLKKASIYVYMCISISIYIYNIYIYTP